MKLTSDKTSLASLAVAVISLTATTCFEYADRLEKKENLEVSFSPSADSLYTRYEPITDSTHWMIWTTWDVQILNTSTATNILTGFEIRRETDAGQGAYANASDSLNYAFDEYVSSLSYVDSVPQGPSEANPPRLATLQTLRTTAHIPMPLNPLVRARLREWCASDSVQWKEMLDSLRIRDGMDIWGEIAGNEHNRVEAFRIIIQTPTGEFDERACFGNHKACE